MPITVQTPRKALARVRRLEELLAQAWRDLEDSVVAASDAGSSYSEIGADLGLSKQRIGDLAKASRARHNVTPTV